MSWCKVKAGEAPPANALVAGYEADGRTPLYIARKPHEGGVHLGKAGPHLKDCHFAFGGRELVGGRPMTTTSSAAAESRPPPAQPGGQGAEYEVLCVEGPKDWVELRWKRVPSKKLEREKLQWRREHGGQQEATAPSGRPAAATTGLHDWRDRYKGPLGRPLGEHLAELVDMPKGALQAGQEKDGKPLFIARAKHAGGVHPGKAGSHLKGGMTLAFNGEEVQKDVFEVLVREDRLSSLEEGSSSSSSSSASTSGKAQEKLH
ncbi:Carbohydrate-binding module family 12 protein [Balamuthia mandrillaris]